MTINNNIIEWVWVDLDDTLWDFSANSIDALTQLYHAEGLSSYFPSIDDWISKYLECNHSLWPLYNAGTITKEVLQLERFRRILDSAGYPGESIIDFSHRLDREYLGRLGRLSRLVPGARELLTALRHNGYKIGVISNGFHEVQFNKMRSSDIERLIDTVVLSDEIGVNKPDLRIFRYAERKASTTARQCVIIGDNPETDIAGGIAADWQAIYFNRNNPNPDTAPESVITIETLMQAIDILHR